MFFSEQVERTSEKGTFRNIYRKARTLMDEQYELFQTWLENDTLISIEQVIQKVGRRTIFGRLLKFDTGKQTILVYDVDQKEVLAISLNEIDRIDPAEAAKRQ